MTLHAALESAPDAISAAAIRVASVPAGHVYVHHLTAGPQDAVVRLPDPAPDDVIAAPGQWWPPAMLDPRWVRGHADDFDVFHIHFGFDALDPADLSGVLDALDAVGKPLVYTVHDLRNPHHHDRRAHDAHLDVLVPRAAALVTLTEGAADVVSQRWGRRPVVLPHPHVVEFARMGGRAERAGDEYVVGLHAKSVRASMDPHPVVAALLPLVPQLPGLRLMVDVHRDVAEPDGARHDAGLMHVLHGASDAGLLQLAVHDCYTDDELWAYLESLDLSVLPYRFGTHSGWLEACHDLGTAVLAPTCGFYAQQRPCLSYRHDESSLDVQSLQAAVRFAYERRPTWRADPAERSAERREIAEAHRALYESVLS